MAFASVCLAVAATLSIQPDRRQFFRYEAFNLSCAVPGNFSGWKVMRNATEEISPCENWGRPNGSSCINRSAYKSDTGLYWCQSEQGECSNTLDIRIHTDVVILESPALPVMEGDNVALRCSHKERYAPNASSDFPAVFYHNGNFFEKRSEGKMVLQKVSMSSKGFYKCQHPTKGESPLSWLEVKEKPKLQSNKPPPSSGSPLMATSSLVCTIILFIIYTIIFILCSMIYRRWARARAEAKRRDGELLKPYN